MEDGDHDRDVWHPLYNEAMLIRKAADIRSSEITPKALYMQRREFIQSAALAAIGTAAALTPAVIDPAFAQVQGPGKMPKLPNVKTSPLSTTEKPTSYNDITSYNNFYEFGTEKEDPAANAK